MSAGTLPNFEYKSDEQVNHFDKNENNVFLIIVNLNASTPRKWYKIPIRTKKLCGKTIAILSLMFQSVLEESMFSDDWEKIIVVLIHIYTLKI